MSNVLATRFANTPVLAAEGQAEWFNECLSAASVEMGRITEREQAGELITVDGFWPEEGSWLSMFRPYRVDNGTLTIPIRGVLLHDFSYQLFDWATGYTYIRRAFERGWADPNVQRIAMVINSGGGQVAGNFDLVDYIYTRRDEKPIQAFVNEHAYSAAFSLASLAHKVTMPRTGGVGSVGVVTAHVDYSGAMDKAGIKVEFVHAGKHKVEGNSYAPLSPDAKNRMQARIQGLYDIFAATVSRNLNISEQAVRDTEALTYSAAEAIEVGFAHEIRPIDEAIAAFAGSTPKTAGDVTMSKEQQIESAVTQADVDAARAEGRQEGAQAERERIQGILGSDEAASRRELAFHLSLNTDMSVESAKGILAVSPETQPSADGGAKGSHFEQAMGQNNPEIEGEGGEGATELSPGEQLIRDYKAASGSAK